MQQLQPLRRHLHIRLRHARDVATRSIQITDEAELDRVGAGFKDDRNGGGRGLGCNRRGGACCSNHRDLTGNQICHHRRQTVILTLRPAIFDRHIVALNIACFAQTFEKGRQLPLVFPAEAALIKPMTRHPKAKATAS